LMDQPEIVYELVRTLHENLSIPVFCKIRVFPSFEKTLEFTKLLERAGCQLLTVHGRTKEMKGLNTALADWDIVTRLKKELSIPVFSNGNIRTYDDVKECLKVTGTDGVMSAESIRKNPALFSGLTPDPFDISFEYLDFCDKYETPIGWVKDHIFHFLMSFVTRHLDWRDQIHQSQSLKQVREVLGRFQEALKNNNSSSDQHEKMIQHIVERKATRGTIDIFGESGAFANDETIASQLWSEESE